MAGQRAINKINTGFIILNATLALVAKQVSKTAMEFEKEMSNVN